FTTTSPLGRQVLATTDAQGRPTAVQDAGLTPVQLVYDSHGRLATMSQGTRTLMLAYDALSNLGSVTDPLGHTASFQYDAAGRVTQQTNPDGGQIQAGYDAAGNVTAVTPPVRPAHDFTYTPEDLVQSYASPSAAGSTNPTQYAYTPD